MHLLPGELCFGVAPEILVDCARKLHQYDMRPLTVNEFSEALGAPIREAVLVLDEMTAAGFFHLKAGEQVLYWPTTKLGQLALANISNGLTRSTASQLLKRVIERAELINSDPEKHACQVVCLVVFGSYLTDKLVLGDLDIGVELREIRGPNERLSIAELRKCMQGAASPTLKAMSALRLQKPKQISIHRLEEVLRIGTPYMIVFGELPFSSTA